MCVDGATARADAAIYTPGIAPPVTARRDGSGVHPACPSLPSAGAQQGLAVSGKQKGLSLLG